MELDFRLITTWAIVFFLASWLLFDPVGAANVIHGLQSALRGAGRSLAVFANSL